MHNNAHWIRHHLAELVVWNFPVCQALADPTVEGENRCPIEPWPLPMLETREVLILAELLLQGPSDPDRKVKTRHWQEVTYQQSWPLLWRLLRTRETLPALVHLHPPQQRSCNTMNSVSNAWINIFSITHSISVRFPPHCKQTWNTLYITISTQAAI